MWTQPTLSGTACWVQVRPWSLEIMTALTSSLPTQRSPGCVRHRKTGHAHAPSGSTTMGWRTKVPAWSNRVSIGPQLRPPSVEMRRRTMAVFWWPDNCAV